VELLIYNFCMSIAARRVIGNPVQERGEGMRTVVIHADEL